MSERISISTTINAPVDQVWMCWTQPQHIVGWNFATEEWICPSAVNDLQPGGNFSWRMEAKDGSMGFDYEGQYVAIAPMKRIEKVLGDGRSVTVQFVVESASSTVVTEVFEVEDKNSAELQRQGWQAILENFRAYVESQS